jgi:hypothetical protein
LKIYAKVNALKMSICTIKSLFGGDAQVGNTQYFEAEEVW